MLVAAKTQHLAWTTGNTGNLSQFLTFEKHSNRISSCRLSNQLAMCNSTEWSHSSTPMPSSHSNHHFHTLLCHWRLLYGHITTKHTDVLFLFPLCDSTLTVKLFEWGQSTVYPHLVCHLSHKRLLGNPEMLWPLWRFPWVAFTFFILFLFIFLLQYTESDRAVKYWINGEPPLTPTHKGPPFLPQSNNPSCSL